MATTASRIDVSAETLERTLGNANVFTSKDTARPVLQAVLLEWKDGKLTATATDSYTLGEAHCKVDGTGEGTFLIDRDDVTKVLRSLKGQKYNTVGLELDGEQLKVSTMGIELTFEPIRGTFPNVGPLWPYPAEGDTGPGRIGWNPDYLARFAKVKVSKGSRYADPTPAAFYLQDDLKPALVTIGLEFRGMIMPVRLDRATDLMPVRYGEEVAA